MKVSKLKDWGDKILKLNIKTALMFNLPLLVYDIENLFNAAIYKFYKILPCGI